MGFEEIKAFGELLQDFEKKDLRSVDLQGKAAQSYMDLCWRRIVGSFHAAGHSHSVDFQVVLMQLLCCCTLVVRASSFFPEQPTGQSAVMGGWRCGFQAPGCLEALFCGIMEHKPSFSLSHS